MKYDFSGWATRNDLRCSDGRTIRRDAFKENDGQTVPLVWNHQHNEPFNVLGHALLENREDGVYAYGFFNDTEAGRNAKALVEHGDVSSLSIYANNLKQQGGDVLHGAIREVSLVLAGANPGAFIDSVMSHGYESEEEAVIYTGEPIAIDATVTSDGTPPEEEPKPVEKKPAPKKKDAVKHSDEGDAEETSEETKESKEEESKEEEPVIEHAEEDKKEETVEDIFNTLTEKQQNMVYALIGKALEEAGVDEEKLLSHSEETAKSEDEETVGDVMDSLTDKQRAVVYALIEHAIEENTNNKSEGDNSMKHNVFEGAAEGEKTEVLSHSDMEAIFADVKRYGSLKESALQHGINNIEYLFPDAKNVTVTPEWLKRDTGWVGVVMNGTRHTPYSRVKSMYANITEADARAKGYLKGNRKIEEFFTVLKRVTEPQTVYKKQKFDRDDVIDITDFDVVAWTKSEMRMMLDEEIARAVLVGDGRNPSSEEKIDETHIRPIWKDDDVYTIKKTVAVSSSATADQVAKAFIRQCVKARKDYKGSGNPVLFTTEDMLTDCLLMEDNTGRIIYETVDKLATALRVSRIITVPVMENQTRISGANTLELAGIIVNLSDYNIGADKGGAVNMFDDFDIDYNAQKYLIETRCSGALIRPYSAIVIELSHGAVLSAAPKTGTILSKSVADIQSGVIVNDDSIQGTLKYVTGWTQYSGDPALQNGNFLAIQFEATEGATTTIQLLGGLDQSPKTLDSDMDAVFRITNPNAQAIKVVSTAGGVSVTKVYDLSMLRLERA